FIGIAILMFFLFFMRVQAQAPFYASLAIFILGMTNKAYRLNFQGFVKLLSSIGRTLGDLIPTLAGVGLLVGALQITGIALSLPYSIITIAGDNVYLMLLIGAFVAIILGMGMSVSAVYIFLALLLAPGLITAGINPMAAHLFILYFGMISSITPPVAIGAIVAAPIAEAPMMKVAFQAMKLGGAIYILPFVFVLNPALILIGSFSEVVWVILTAAIGLVFLGAFFEGYLWSVGSITWITRMLVGIMALMLIIPESAMSLFGLAGIIIIIIGLKLLVKSQNGVVRFFVKPSTVVA
ncbi:MAG: TRAP transporter large permease subunit, partial [Mobilitalea sp.]